MGLVLDPYLLPYGWHREDEPSAPKTADHTERETPTSPVSAPPGARRRLDAGADTQEETEGS